LATHCYHWRTVTKTMPPFNGGRKMRTSIKTLLPLQSNILRFKYHLPLLYEYSLRPTDWLMTGPLSTTSKEFCFWRQIKAASKRSVKYC
jgi:hypothetical protein